MKLTVVYFDVLVLCSRNEIGFVHRENKITENIRDFKLTSFNGNNKKIIILLRKVYAVAATTKKYQLTKNVCVSSSQAVGTSGSALIVACVPFVVRSKKII